MGRVASERNGERTAAGGPETTLGSVEGGSTGQGGSGRVCLARSQRQLEGVTRTVTVVAPGWLRNVRVGAHGREVTSAPTAVTVYPVG